MINELLKEANSEDESDISSLSSDKSMLVSSISSDSSWSSLVSGATGTSTYSLIISQPSSDGPEMATPAFTEFIDAIRALHDEAQKSCVLNSRPKIPHAPQLHLLPEWEMHAPDKFLRKLQVLPIVFDNLVKHVEGHENFYNRSNNPQLPVPIQLAIFLNGIGHYGNAATTEDLADWAGVSVGTVYNCIK
ncbi:hypothetical protein EDD22DRAFT_958763 [Suillus occidentalis]|nr:hypothetical protein EDD22DRAFT_958763 [Suillus occidentalis]